MRTLGLAALLARATKYDVPILIFDDAINAIDSDHRDNITFLLTGKISNQDGQKLFNDNWGMVKEYLNKCQFVITTHDRFFDKKISSILEDIYNEKDGNYVWFFEILNQESHYRRLDHINLSHAPTSKEVEIIFKKIQEINYIYAK